MEYFGIYSYIEVQAMLKVLSFLFHHYLFALVNIPRLCIITLALSMVAILTL